MIDNYFFIDGSALLAQTRTLGRSVPGFKGRKLYPMELISYFSRALSDIHAHQFKRAVFYFPVGDKTEIEEYLMMPNFKESGVARDMHFKYCGEKLKNSNAFNKFVSEKVPSKWHDRFAKSEKGVDIEICCDALKLAARGKIERLFLLTNDRDFIPLCKTLKDFGANISLLHLSEDTNVNEALVKECDTYNYVPKDYLDGMFAKKPVVNKVFAKKRISTKTPKKIKKSSYKD